MPRSPLKTASFAALARKAKFRPGTMAALYGISLRQMERLQMS
jgi:hypothetical protein